VSLEHGMTLNVNSDARLKSSVSYEELKIILCEQLGKKDFEFQKQIGFNNIEVGIYNCAGAFEQPNVKLNKKNTFINSDETLKDQLPIHDYEIKDFKGLSLRSKPAENLSALNKWLSLPDLQKACLERGFIESVDIVQIPGGMTVREILIEHFRKVVRKWW